MVLHRRAPLPALTGATGYNRDFANEKNAHLLGCIDSNLMPHRYLVQFGPKQTPHSSPTSSSSAPASPGCGPPWQCPPACDVLVVTKDSIQQSNSTYAQGGIAGVLSPEDRFENHIEDTLTAGAGLCDRAIVEMVVREAPEQINDLIRWGTHFDEEDGQLALTREGGHSHRRIVHALGDATGHEVMRAIIDRARQTPQRHPLGRDLHARPADPRGRAASAPWSRGRARTSC